MTPLLLQISLKQVQVEFNGDEVHKSGSKARSPASPEDTAAQDNLIIASLQYPRPGAPVVTTTKALDLPSGFTKSFDKSEFWESLLFKETVYGETVLQVLVSDRDNRSTFLRIAGLIMSAGIGGLLGASIKGITNVVLGSVATGTTEPLLGAIKNAGGKGNTKVIGKSAKISIRVEGESIVVGAPQGAWDSNMMELKLGLTCPEDLHYIDLSDPERKRRTIVEKDAPNGYVVLSIRVDAVAPARLAV
jgi:hypothetical protein